MKTLLPHQEACFSRFQDDNAAAIHMEMRLGKTLTSIRWVEHRLRACGITHPRVLVLAPGTPLMAWMDELTEEGLEWVFVSGSRSQRIEAASRGVRWSLMQYSSLVHTPELASAQRWDAVICDESTAIKNPAAKITKLVTKKLSSVRIRAILTGLAVPEDYRDIFTQMQFASGGAWMGFGNYWAWFQRWFYRAGFEDRLRTGAAEKIKAAFHASAFVLTRAEAGVGGLKDPVVRTHELTAPARAVYDSVQKSWSIPGTKSKCILEVANWLRRIAGGFLPTCQVETLKVPCVLELAKLHGKIVVWFAFNREMGRVFSALSEAGFRPTFISGLVPLQARKHRVELFRQSKRDVMLIQLQCGKYGIDLSTAKAAVYYSNSYSYETRRQSEDRLIHPLKSSKVPVYDLVARRTIDEDIAAALAAKESSASYFITKLQEKLRAPL